jgi:hypothetical protein
MRQIKINVSNIGLTSNGWPISHYAYRDMLSQLPKEIKLVRIESNPTRIDCFWFFFEHDDFKDSPATLIPEVVVRFDLDINGIVKVTVKDIDKHIEKKLPTGTNTVTGSQFWYGSAYPSHPLAAGNTGSKVAPTLDELAEVTEKLGMTEKKEEKKSYTEQVRDFFFKPHHPKCTCGQKYTKDAIHDNNCPSRFKEVKQ